MFCSNCGAVVTGKFCSNCGKKASSDIQEYRKLERAAKKEFMSLHRRTLHDYSKDRSYELFLEACWYASTFKYGDRIRKYSIYTTVPAEVFEDIEKVKHHAERLFDAICLLDF